MKDETESNNEYPYGVDHSSRSRAYRWKNRCTDPYCRNPRCHNYIARQCKSDDEERDGGEYEHHYHGSDYYYRSSHLHHNLDEMLEIHHDRKHFYDESEEDVEHEKKRQTYRRLKEIDHQLNVMIRELLEFTQSTLCEQGYATGIHDETEEIVDEEALYNRRRRRCDEADQDDDSTETDHDCTDPVETVVTGISLHMQSVPAGTEPSGHHRNESEISKTIRSTNTIRFSTADGVDGELDTIQCHFGNSKMQSKQFLLSPSQCNREDETQHIKSLIQDFVSFILLCQRAKLEAV